MYQEAFQKLEPAEATDILEDLNPKFDGSTFDPNLAVILAQNMPFYPGYRLLDIADYASVPAKRRYVIYANGRAEILDFTNGPIYKLNKDLPISLDDKNVCDYVRFFFTHVRGAHGKFMIVEGVDDINWKDDPPPAARKAIGKMITPITLKPSSISGIYQISLCMIFKDSLFKRTISVDSSGIITLGEEELLVEDMPVMDDTFGH